MREPGINAGFYFWIKPQEVDGSGSGRLYDLVAPFDPDLSERFMEMDDLSPKDERFPGAWFLNESSSFDSINCPDFNRSADFGVLNGDFSALAEQYNEFMRKEAVTKLIQFMTERYGSESFEIRLGAIGTYS